MESAAGVRQRRAPVSRSRFYNKAAAWRPGGAAPRVPCQLIDHGSGELRVGFADDGVVSAEMLLAAADAAATAAAAADTAAAAARDGDGDATAAGGGGGGVGGAAGAGAWHGADGGGGGGGGARRGAEDGDMDDALPMRSVVVLTTPCTSDGGADDDDDGGNADGQWDWGQRQLLLAFTALALLNALASTALLMATPPARTVGAARGGGWAEVGDFAVVTEEEAAAEAAAAALSGGGDDGAAPERVGGAALVWRAGPDAGVRAHYICVLVVLALGVGGAWARSALALTAYIAAAATAFLVSIPYVPYFVWCSRFIVDAACCVVASWLRDSLSCCWVSTAQRSVLDH